MKKTIFRGVRDRLAETMRNNAQKDEKCAQGWEWLNKWAKSFATEKREFAEQKTRVNLRTLCALCGQFMQCGCKYTPDKKARGYDAAVRKQAIRLYADGMNLRRIGRHLKVHHRTVSLWVQAHSESLPDAPVPEQVETAELDELYTFLMDKKTGSTS